MSRIIRINEEGLGEDKCKHCGHKVKDHDTTTNECICTKCSCYRYYSQEEINNIVNEFREKLSKMNIRLIVKESFN